MSGYPPRQVFVTPRGPLRYRREIASEDPQQLANEPRAFTSEINPTYPVFGNPTTASVRANFLYAREEIEDLYRRVAALEAAGATGTLGGDVTGAGGANTVQRIQGRAVAPTAPTNGQALVWVEAAQRWEPRTVSGVEPPTGVSWDGGNTTWDNGNTTWSS